MIKRGKNKKAMELAMSTLVVIILALLILGVSTLAFTIGWDNFWSKLKGFFVSDIDATEKACINACTTQSKYDFCCLQREVDFGKGKEKINCTDERLKVECDINCEGAC